MASSKSISISLISLSLLFLHQINATSSTNPLLYNICSTSEGNFTSSSSYQSQLTNLFKLLTFKKSTLSSTGFATATVGPKDATSAYGLALCRGDVASTDCTTCVANATKEIRELCPQNKAAIVWYDDCLLKYSDSNFFGKIDEMNKFYMWNVNLVNNVTLFNEKTKEMLTKLSEEAVEGGGYKMFATGEMELDTFTNLYGLVQCTMDLSSSDCKKCLDEAIGDLPSCCDGKQGGRVVGGSCNFRYEIYPFVNE